MLKYSIKIDNLQVPVRGTGMLHPIPPTQLHRSWDYEERYQVQQLPGQPEQWVLIRYNFPIDLESNDVRLMLQINRKMVKTI